VKSKRAAVARSIAVLAALALAAAAPGRVSAQAPHAAETFDAVWKIVRDTRFDPAFDLDRWDQIRTELRPRAVAARTPGELREVLSDMLGRLGLSHFAVIPSTPDAPGESVDLSGDPGLDVRLMDGHLVVTAVTPDGGAAEAGVHTGWIVHSVNGAPLGPALERTIADAPSRVAPLEAWRLAQKRLRGPSGSEAQIAFQDGAGAIVKSTVERKPERGEPVTVGSLPTMYVRVNTSLHETPAGHHAGVIAFNVWMTAVDRPFADAMQRFRDTDGIVIDLRGNPGGLAAMIMGIAGHFLTNHAILGVMKTRDSELRFAANPRLVTPTGERTTPYAGPVAILIDGMTGSASECFAGGMQSLGRARVFGETSMGQALPALFDRLPNGDVLIHAWGDFVTGTGVRIEGRGVVPDEPVAITREALLTGHDLPLEAALRWVDSQAAETGARHRPRP
jgi:carboxyl-terminal processing protease